MSWVQLVRRSDWGNEYFAMPGTCGMASRSKEALEFEEGRVIRLRLKDGTEASVPVKHKNLESQISDHGHSYSVQFKLAGFEVTAPGGYTFWVPLDQAEVHKRDVPSPPIGTPSVKP